MGNERQRWSPAHLPHDVTNSTTITGRKQYGIATSQEDPRRHPEQKQLQGLYEAIPERAALVKNSGSTMTIKYPGQNDTVQQKWEVACFGTPAQPKIPLIKFAARKTVINHHGKIQRHMNTHQKDQCTSNARRREDNQKKDERFTHESQPSQSPKGKPHEGSPKKEIYSITKERTHRDKKPTENNTARLPSRKRRPRRCSTVTKNTRRQQGFRLYAPGGLRRTWSRYGQKTKKKQSSNQEAQKVG